MPLQHQEHETGHGQTPTAIWRDHIRRDLWRKGRRRTEMDPQRAWTDGGLFALGDV